MEADGTMEKIRKGHKRACQGMKYECLNKQMKLDIRSIDMDDIMLNDLEDMDEHTSTFGRVVSGAIVSGAHEDVAKRSADHIPEAPREQRHKFPHPERYNFEHMPEEVGREVIGSSSAIPIHDDEIILPPVPLPHIQDQRYSLKALPGSP